MNTSLACLVISLRRSPERRGQITAALDRLGIAFAFVDAVDAADGIEPALYDTDAIRRNLGRDMSTGEIACALSHARAYELFLAGTASHALIFEDDALPGPDLRRFIDAGLFASAPMVLFYYARPRVLRGAGRPLFGEVRSHRLALPVAGAVGYALNRESARRLLDAARPVGGVADWPMDITLLDAEITVPMLVGHPPPDLVGQSLLEAERGRKRRHGLRHYLSRAYLRRKWRKAISVRLG